MRSDEVVFDSYLILMSEELAKRDRAAFPEYFRALAVKEEIEKALEETSE